MYISNHPIDKPPESILSKCTKVSFDDPIMSTHIMEKWCCELGLSLIWCDSFDLSDFSAGIDSIDEFYFEKEEDAVLFRLRFQ